MTSTVLLGVMIFFMLFWYYCLFKGACGDYIDERKMNIAAYITIVLFIGAILSKIFE